MTPFDEEQAEHDAERAQAALDHGLDLELERADCDPIDRCPTHGVHLVLSGDCVACLDDLDARRDRDRSMFDPHIPVRRNTNAA